VVKDNQLKHLVEQDLALFKLTGPFGGKPRSLPGDMCTATDSNQDPFFLYREPGNNDLCDRCMSDIDNSLCHGAKTLLLKSLGDRAGQDFIYQTMNDISSHYRSIEVQKIINLDLLVNYMSTQAFAIPTLWHAERLKKKYGKTECPARLQGPSRREISGLRLRPHPGWNQGG
jgi:hypothetical protein